MKGFRGIVLPILLALLAPSGSFALDPTKAVTQYTHDAWSGEGALPQVSVQAIHQSRDGYLWLGTQEGVVRFDGVRFVSVNTQDVGGFCEGRDGTLWMSSYEGLLGIRGGETRRLTTADGLSSNRVNGVCEDLAGALWLATSDGLDRWDGGKVIRYGKAEGLPDAEVSCVAPARGGTIWAGTPKGLARVEDGRVTAFSARDGLPEGGVTQLLEDSSGTLWIGTTQGLGAFRKGRIETFRTPPGSPPLQVKALAEDRDGNLWIGTAADGLARMRDGRLDWYTAKEGLTNNAVWSLFEDREGSLWIGTFGGGLNRLKDEKFTTYDTAVGLSEDTVWAVLEASDRTLWIGTDGGLNAYRDGKFKVFTKRDGLPADSVSSLLEDRDGALWVGTDGGGLARFFKGRFTRYAEAQGLTHLRVFSLLEDRAGTLWIGTSGGGLFRLREGRITPFGRAEGLSDLFVRALLEDREGAVWVGTNGGGLFRYKGGVFTRFSAAQGLSDDFVRDLYQDRGGTLWVGTRAGGLCRYENGAFRAFRVRDGLYSDRLYSILEDARGNLWMSCNRGVFRVSRQDLDDFAAGKAASIACVGFGSADGMKSAECNGGTYPAGWRGRDGSLWFATIRGVVRVDPQNMRTNELPPPVVLEHLLVDGHPLDLAHAVAPPGSDRIEFAFTALSLVSPAKVRFRFTLEGHDREWVELPGGRERLAVYTNLPPGSYTFRVQACNNDGVWNETGASCPLRLRPRFYETWPFYILATLALLALGGGLYHGAAVALANLRMGRNLSRYHSRNVIEKLRAAKGGDVALLASERRRVTVLFCDLTGFSDFSDRSEPEAVNRVINEYLTEMSSLIETQGGTIARFMGDGIMAFFGAPGEMAPEEQARCAVAAAVAMQNRMAVLRKRWLEGGMDQDFHLRVGISQDYATVGNFGSDTLMEYTALGSTVNLAARLETGCAPGRILVSFPVFAATRDLYTYEAHERREFKGFARPVNVAELIPPT